MSTKAFQAYFKGRKATASTPRAAAEKFFSTFPDGRKCHVIEGEKDGIFFVIRYGRRLDGGWPQSWEDITRKTLSLLPA